MVRILRGKLKKNSKIVTSKGIVENVQRIYEPLADEYREINEIGAGNVAILAGLKVRLEPIPRVPFKESLTILRIHRLEI